MPIAVSSNHPPILDQKVFNPFPDVDPYLNLGSQKFEELRTNCKYFSIVNTPDVNVSDENLSILHINARSLFSDEKFDEFKSMIYRTGKTWDIICVSETWLQNGMEHNRQIGGYTSFFDNRFGQIGGGVAVYIHDVKVEGVHQLNTCIKSTQSLIIEINLPNQISLIVVQVYRPPSLDQNIFIEELESCLENLTLNNKSVFICGDFNFDLFSINHISNVQEFLSTLTSSGFWPLISKTSRASDQSLSLIDNIYSNNLSLIKDSGIIIEDTTDHFPIFINLTIKLPPQRETLEKAKRFDFHKIPELKDHLLHALRDFENVNDPEQASLMLVNAYTSGIDKYSFLHKSNRKDSPLKPWITPAILSCINTRCNLFITKQKAPTLINKQKYNRYRNILNSVIRSAKKRYIENQLHLNKNNSKKMWEVLLSHTRGLGAQNQFPESFHGHGNTIITDHDQIAHHFNNYFSSVGKKLQEKIPPSPSNPLEFIETCEHLTSRMEPCTINEVKDIIQNLKNVGAGVDGLNAKVFKATYEVIISMLTHFINICLKHGKFPSNLKIAVIKPIYKSGDKQNVSNYRPISILPLLSKILEKIIYARLMIHLDARDILCLNQYGFRKKMSTYMPLLLVQENITKAFENGKMVCGLYLDLKKAFDTVDHDILLSKLSLYGISGIFFNMIKSYLTDRYQCVEFKKTRSSLNAVNIGVPQGSILGPLLFILYANDFPNICTNSLCLLYADDTAIFFESRTESGLQNAIDVEVPKIVNWFNSNKLSINSGKTYCQMYKNTQCNVNIKVHLNGAEIAFVDKVKYLGMYIDTDLKWRSHIDHICNLFSRNVGIIKRSSFFLDQKHLLLLYNALCLPYINYCCLIWGHSQPTLLARINKIQKKVVRVIDGQHRLAHTAPIFVKLNLLKISDIAVQQSIILMYNVLIQNVPLMIRSLFTLQDVATGHRTRSIRHFQEPFSAKLYATRTLSWIGPRLWNTKIAPTFPYILTVHETKNAIKKYVKAQSIAAYALD